jgi:hypothetical protein
LSFSNHAHALLQACDADLLGPLRAEIWSYTGIGFQQYLFVYSTILNVWNQQPLTGLATIELGANRKSDEVG